MNRQQARPASRPLVRLPGGKMFTEEDAERLTLPEQLRLLTFLLAVAIVVLLSLPGQS